MSLLIINLANHELTSLAGFFQKYSFKDHGVVKQVGQKMGVWIDTRYLQLSLSGEPPDGEMPVKKKKKKEPGRHWWSTLFRRRPRWPEGHTG